MLERITISNLVELYVIYVLYLVWAGFLTYEQMNPFLLETTRYVIITIIFNIIIFDITSSSTTQ